MPATGNRHTFFEIRQCYPLFSDDEATRYEALDIQAGNMASMIYADLDRIDDENEKQNTRESSLDFCTLGKLAMVMSWQKPGDLAELS